MANLPKDAEPYKDSINAMLAKFPDNAVVKKGFSLKDMILLHKGKDVDKLVKEAEKKGYKRGLENKRILGERRQPGGQTKTKTDVTGTPKGYGLDEAGKQEALAFFKDNNISDKRKFEIYADMKKREKELKK